MSTKNLGFVKAIHRGINPPDNTEMLWYNTNTNENRHYYYDLTESAWKPFNSCCIESGELECKTNNLANNAVIYVVYDTSSLSPSAVTYLKDNIVAPWFANYKAENPNWGGSLKEYTRGDENWLQWAGIAYTERNDPSYTGEVILIAFIDESEPTYHGSNIPLDNTNQPTANYVSDYNNFMDVSYPYYKSFTGFIYAVPSLSLDDPNFTGKQFVRNFTAQVAMAIKGKDWIESEIVIPPIVSESGISEENAFKAALMNNPYKALTKGRLENFNWGFEYDFSVGAEEITLVDFTNTIENFLNSSVSNLLKITLYTVGGGTIEFEAPVNCWFTGLITQQTVIDIVNAINKGANEIVSTIAERDNIDTDEIDSGYKVFVVETGELYSWNGSSWVFESKISGLTTITTLWKTDGTYTTLTTPQPIRLSKSLQEGQSANIAVVNDAILPASGNYCSFTGTGTINRISKYDANGIEFQGGTAYDLYVLAGMTIKHNYTSNNQTTYKKILIDAQQDWTASTDTLIHMRYDSLLEAWVVSGTATGDILKDSTNILALPMQANGYNVASGGNITGWLENELTGYTVTNVGGATVSINANTYIAFGAGDLYGIKIYDSDGELKFELACCENNVNVPYLHCSVTGRVFYITNMKTVIKQDTYFKCKENGWQRVTITESGDIMDVAYKNDKTKIYE